MKRLFKIGTVCFVIVALTCCEREHLTLDVYNTVNISLENVQTTKAPAPKARIIKSMDLTDSLCLTVKVSDNPVSQELRTKATGVTTNSFPELYGTCGFTVYAEKQGDASTALFDNALFKLDNRIWRPETETPWPGYATDYYAWAPSEAAELSSGSKSFAYSVSPDNGSQVDLLVARTQTPEGFSGSVPMTFEHALCEVKFTVNENVPAGSFYSLKIYNLKMNGTYDFTTGEWTIPGNAATGDVTLDLSSSPVVFGENAVEGQAITSESQSFFVIPQTKTPYTAGIELQFKGQYDSEPQTYYLDFEDGIVFESNKCYTFAIGQTPKDFIFRVDPLYNSGVTLTNDVRDSEELLVHLDSFKYNPDDWLDPDDPDYTMYDFLLEEYPAYLYGEWDDYFDWFPWHIKSYVINGVTKDYSEDALMADGGVDAKIVDFEIDGEVIENHYSLSVTGLARDVVENKLPSNEAWTGSFGLWSPEDWSDKDVIDLSRMDVTKDTYAESVNAFNMTTANCYVVRHAGHYKLPLVYGNAIYKGAVNEGSYNPSKINGIQEHFSKDRIESLKTLVNHLENEISSPFIEQNEGIVLASGTNAYDILWQDQDQIVTIDKIQQEDVEIINADGNVSIIPVSYLYFTIPQNLICQNNALLCVKDTEGRIIWSWHIWTTNNPSLLDDAIMVTSTVNANNQHFYFHPMNSIGWIDPAETCAGRNDVELVLEQVGSGKELSIQIRQPETGISSSGSVMYYQWGRKDPFPSKGFCSLDEAPLANGSLQSDASEEEHQVSKSILSPTLFLCGPEDDYGEAQWFKPDYCNLWGAYANEYIYNEKDWYNYFSDFNIKTVYDPSPIGYKVPIPPAFDGFKIREIRRFPPYSGFNKGIDFWTYPQDLNNVPDYYPSIFFAASGFRSAKESGTINNHDSVIAYWNSYSGGFHNSVDSYFLYFDYENLVQDEKFLEGTYTYLPSFSFLKQIIVELHFNGSYNLTNGIPVRPVLYERFENETHIGNGNIVTPYEDENYTIEW